MEDYLSSLEITTWIRNRQRFLLSDLLLSNSLLVLKMLCISGAARSGKDTFYKLLDKKFPGTFSYLALATVLKEQVDPISRERFNFSAFTQNPEEKKILRPLLVEYAKKYRKESKGTFYTKAIEPSVNKIQADGLIPVVIDIRYDEFPEDEVTWALKQDSLLVHITRYDKDGIIVPPPNDDERLNDPKVRAKAHFRVCWHTADKLDELMSYLDFLNEFIWKIKP